MRDSVLKQHAYSVAAMRQLGRRLPRAVFDFVDGGAEDEVTLQSNETAFRYTWLLPNPLQGTTVRDQSIELFGERLPGRVLIGPTGLTGMLWPRSEIDRVMALCGWDRLEQIDRSVLFDPAARPESVLSAVNRKLTSMLKSG